MALVATAAAGDTKELNAPHKALIETYTPRIFSGTTPPTTPWAFTGIQPKTGDLAIDTVGLACYIHNGTDWQIIGNTLS